MQLAEGQADPEAGAAPARAPADIPAEAADEGAADTDRFDSARIPLSQLVSYDSL